VDSDHRSGDTTTRRIEDALLVMRHRLGGPAAGKVLTLVIVTDEAGQHDALHASLEASRDPSEPDPRRHPAGGHR
jgi:hypothetical protein